MDATPHRLIALKRLIRITLVFLAGTLPCPASAPSVLEPVDKAWLEEHYTKHERRIPMRDGIKLFTAIYTPKDSRTNYPFLITRTPYSVKPYGAEAHQDPRGLIKYFARDGFIFVLQDVRGRYASEGEFVHVRPIRSEASPGSQTDESTDAWDTIEWLVRNVPNNNGRAGLCGISYPGFYSSAGAIDSHPALKLTSPQAPVGDWFIGDDFRHNGCLYQAHAFHFLSMFETPLEKPLREAPKFFDYETPDGYEFHLKLGPLANADSRFFRGKVPFWNEVLQQDTYNEFWKQRRILPRLRNIRAAVLNVGGWFDAEDLYGTLETYRSIENQNPGIFNVLVMGPWAHGQWHKDDGQRLGHVNFRSKTAEKFRQEIELPFFREVLKGQGNPALKEALVFETGSCEWKNHSSWPPPGVESRSLYFHPGGRLDWAPAPLSEPAFDEYTSDPMKPVPFIPNVAATMTVEHMLDDQRFAASRTDVLVYQTAPLEEDVALAGPIKAALHVSTSGTDSDWVVKLIDVYPADHPNPDPNPQGVQLGGFQQLIRGEPMRGKFRRSFENPVPFEPGTPELVQWTMPDVSHAFRRGHRIMIQVQSSWFPLVDRNPQTFCRIGEAREDQFVKAQQRLYRTPSMPSHLAVSLLTRKTSLP
ncbi:MAG: CocE/NonD family hydrolase [Verrucomicrobia bacterium]|nr:CocE/NonD family hydrolase [Verrucomicrobiota bacterium]